MSRARGNGKRTPRVGGATATSSLYERYKDALRRGHVAALRGRNEAAVDAYREAADIAPDRALPHASIGGILVKMGRVDEASVAYERALALAPRDETALRGLAEIHIRADRRSDAASALDRLADTLHAAGRLADATDAARRALELAESRARRQQVEGFAGKLRAASGGDETAQRALDQALRILEPSHATAEANVEAEPTVELGAEPEAAIAWPEPEPEAEATELQPEAVAEVEAEPEPEPEPEPAVEPAGLGIALGAAAEAALHAGDFESARNGLLAAARAHRRAGRMSAAVDACYLAIAVAPAHADLHLLLTELYLDRGWQSQAVEKLLLLGRLAELDGDQGVRERICALAAERLADEPRLADLCA
ncbi:MAG TPA: tetratricopeptide repeat protein [Candidatus Limnocylindrales bacterium]